MTEGLRPVCRLLKAGCHCSTVFWEGTGLVVAVTSKASGVLEGQGFFCLFLPNAHVSRFPWGLQEVQ